jgi:hypothetical protein
VIGLNRHLGEEFFHLAPQLADRLLHRLRRLKRDVDDFYVCVAAAVI